MNLDSCHPAETPTVQGMKLYPPPMFSSMSTSMSVQLPRLSLLRIRPTLSAPLPSSFPAIHLHCSQNFGLLKKALLHFTRSVIESLHHQQSLPGSALGTSMAPSSRMSLPMGRSLVMLLEARYNTVVQTSCGHLSHCETFSRDFTTSLLVFRKVQWWPCNSPLILSFLLSSSVVPL